MRNKKILVFMLFFIMINLIAPLAVRTAFGATLETDSLKQFNQLVGSNYAKDDYLTRENFCVAISKIFIKNYKGSTELPFVDIEKLSKDSKYHLSVLYNKKILNGVKRNGLLYMRPNQIITRQEAVTLLGKMLSKYSLNEITFHDEDLVQSYAYRYVAWFYENGLDIGYPDGSYGPTDRMTAGELAVLTAKSMDYERAGKVNIETVWGREAEDI